MDTAISVKRGSSAGRNNFWKDFYVTELMIRWLGKMFINFNIVSSFSPMEMGKSKLCVKGWPAILLIPVVWCQMRGPFGNWASGEEMKHSLDIFLPIAKVVSILEAIISKIALQGIEWGKNNICNICQSIFSPSKIPIHLKCLIWIGLFLTWLWVTSWHWGALAMFFSRVNC